MLEFIVQNVFILFSSAIPNSTTVAIGIEISYVLVEISTLEVSFTCHYKGLYKGLRLTISK